METSSLERNFQDLGRCCGVLLKELESDIQTKGKPGVKLVLWSKGPHLWRMGPDVICPIQYPDLFPSVCVPWVPS
jgi:hypothetical protein